MRNKILWLVFVSILFACSNPDTIDFEEIIEEPTEETLEETTNIAPDLSNNYVKVDIATTYQTVDGFGAGIKRRTEDLYDLSAAKREKIEEACFRDLEVNMIRFFVYHDLEDENDNDDPFLLDESKLNWIRYDSDDSNWRSRYVGEALNNAFRLSVDGFDHVIGNCNSAPKWLKTNGTHNGGGTLIPGGEDEFSEFLVAFLKGMKYRYDIDVTAISPTNEPDYEVSYESMNTTPAELSSIIKNLDSRLATESLDHIKIISPECFRVEASNPARSATNYINQMFTDEAVKSAIDVVATHTYADKDHDADWNALKVASDNKPIWVTESASLKSLDDSMTDAAHYIKWITKGFNKGNLTAYMAHMFYEPAGNSEGASALVLWDARGNVILPKRYHSYKHFTNLVKKGFVRVKSDIIGANLHVIGFKSPDGSKIVLQVFNESENQDITFDVFPGTTAIEHYRTSDDDGENFLKNDIKYNDGDKFLTLSIQSMSMHSIVFNIGN